MREVFFFIFLKCRNVAAAMFKIEIISYNNIELLPTLMQFPIFHVQLFIFLYFFLNFISGSKNSFALMLIKV